MAANADPLSSLTARERDVLDLLRLGLPDSEIAHRLGISAAGVSYHVSAIIGKLGVQNRHQAASWPDPPPWWTKALAPIAALWRRVPTALPFSGGSLAGVVAVAFAVALVSGFGLLAVLLVRANSGDGGAKAPVAGQTKPPQFSTFAVVARLPTATPTSTPPSTSAAENTAEPLTATLTANPSLQIVGSCILSYDSEEIFPAEASARGQRVFESPGNRWYLRSDGTCVHLFVDANATPPDYAPQTVEATAPARVKICISSYDRATFETAPDPVSHIDLLPSAPSAVVSYLEDGCAQLEDLPSDRYELAVMTALESGVMYWSLSVQPGENGQVNFGIAPPAP